MFDFDELARKTQRILSVDRPIIVGILGVPSDLVGDITAIITAGSIADDLGVSALTDGILTAGGLRAAREVNARSQGVSVRLVVAVTPETIHLLSLPAVGTNPGKEVMRFHRATTSVQVSRHGLARRIKLTDFDNGQKIRLTGGVAPWSRYAAGTKAIVSELTP
ncbi:hypothetical protein [Actinoplanes subtropicus]|uniref:hypothetical protein n=1 Tax=Actinoplanes subtropicus TaxID=543632 RepID=UPI0004C3B071|nr:hypothetical protein [Actinoplanes subtropicus]